MIKRLGRSCRLLLTRLVFLVVACVLNLDCGTAGAARISDRGDSPGDPKILSDGEVFDRLWTALQSGDRSVVPLIREVLSDELGKRYRFKLGTRDTARDLICRFQLSDFAPQLRQIASMSYTGQPDVHKTGDLGEQQTLDIYAICEALDNLVCLHDQDAVLLNRRGLDSDPAVQRDALMNLTELSDWDAADLVKDVLDRTPADAEHSWVIIAAAWFLTEAPVHTRDVCPLTRRLRLAFTSCLAAEHDWDTDACPDLKRALGELSARRKCADE